MIGNIRIESNDSFEAKQGFKYLANVSIMSECWQHNILRLFGHTIGGSSPYLILELVSGASIM